MSDATDPSTAKKLEQVVAASQVAATDGQTEKGLATVSLQSLFRLLEKAVQPTPSPPKPLSYLSLKVTGQTTALHHVRFTCVFEILILGYDWTVASLVSDKVALVASSVRRVILDASSLPTVSEDLTKNSPAVQPAVAVYKDQHSLICNRPGKYIVSLDILAPYTTNRETGVRLDIPSASFTSLSFSVHQSDVNISVEPALKSDTTVDAAAATTSVAAKIPPTGSITIQWSQKIDANEFIVKEQLPLHAVVEQQHLMSVGESMLIVMSTFEYTIQNGALSAVEIVCDPSLKILNVETNKGALKRWDVTTIEPTDPSYHELDLPTDDGEDYSSLKGKPRQLLRVLLEYGIETSLELRVSSEKDLGSTSCTFAVPCFRHVRGPVNRERGFIAIEARTNVEVEQLDTTAGISYIDVAELPGVLRKRASNPLLLAYKYLLPIYNIELEVKKHADVDVLIAAVDDAHYVATYTEEGKLMVQLVLRVRNTQKQYLRMLIPAECEIWSTVVSGVPVKPAKDSETGEVMIPLQKSSKTEASSSETSQPSFYVELLYVRQPSRSERQHLAMQTRGTVSISFPRLDIPVNHLYVSCWVPSDFVYGEFTGDLREVKYFTKTPPVAPKTTGHQQQAQTNWSNILDEDELGGYGGKRMERQASISYSEAPKFLSSMSKSAVKTKTNYKYHGGQKHAGVVPVKVEMITSGTQFRFERLLVVNQTLAVSVPYKKTEKGYFKKRHIKKMFICC